MGNLFRPSSWAWAGVVTGVFACSGGTEVITPPPPPAGGLTLSLVPDPEDETTAAALGWQSGIPQATVTLTPVDSSRAPISATTAADGSVTVDDFSAGDYLLEATRWLSDGERGVLAAGDDAVGFAGRRPVQATGHAQSVSIEVRARRRHGLAISEWAFNHAGIPGIGAYDLDGFLEIYNNADTTIYLDGMVIAEGFRNGVYDHPVFPCAETRPFREDTAGVWSWMMQRFPGTGRSNPIQPGEPKVIATDAIDHRSLFPDALDLSAADFEFSGSADVDNPAAPNLLDIGLISYIDGHGLEFSGLGIVAVLALPLDPSQLSVGNAGGADYVRIPRSLILDVLTLRSNFANATAAECPRLVAPNIDREWSSVRGTDERVEHQYSVSRRMALAIGGRPVFWHTRDSHSDFERTSRTPGRTR